MSDRVRVCTDYQNTRYYFVRYLEDGRPDVAEGNHIHLAPLLNRDFALVLAKKLNLAGPRRWRIITPENVFLFDEAIAPPTPPAPPVADPVPMFVGDVLIVPGNPPRHGFYIRFPNAPFESLWAPSADEAYQKLLEHPRASILIPLAERYLPPPPAPEPEAIPTYRARPGNRH